MYVKLKNKHALLFILIFASRLSYGQISSNSTTKDGVPFFENFYNNKSGWPVQSSDNYNFSFKGRKYDMDSSREGMIEPVVNTPFDHSRDYSITCTVNHISGLSESGYGLTFSYENSGNMYQFEIATQGYYRVIRVQDNTITQVISWTDSDNIIKEDGQPNKLKILKKGSSCELYINDVVVNSFNDFESEGNYTGFVIENKQHVVASLLAIQYN